MDELEKVIQNKDSSDDFDEFVKEIVINGKDADVDKKSEEVTSPFKSDTPVV